MKIDPAPPLGIRGRFLRFRTGFRPYSGEGRRSHLRPAAGANRVPTKFHAEADGLRVSVGCSPMGSRWTAAASRLDPARDPARTRQRAASPASRRVRTSQRHSRIYLYTWVFHIWFFDRPEIADFGGVWAAPGGRETLQKGGGASPSTFLEGLPAARGHQDPQNRRFHVFRSVKISYFFKTQV